MNFVLFIIVSNFLILAFLVIFDVLQENGVLKIASLTKSPFGFFVISDERNYPDAVANIASKDNFPMKVAGYQRGDTFMYQPDVLDISICYNLQNKDTVTLFYYPKTQSFVEQFSIEKQQVVSAYPQAVLLCEEEISLSSKGIIYSALKAQYSLKDRYYGKKEEVYSQLILIDHPIQFVKIRTTAPVRFSALLESTRMQLLDSINWALLDLSHQNENNVTTT